MTTDHLGNEFSNFIHLSRYARWDYTKKRRESWAETVERYVEFFVPHLKERCNYELSDKEISSIRKSILNLEVMPSMRALMTAGKALKRDESSGYNCSALAINRPRAFDELFFNLLCGCFDPQTKIRTKNGIKQIQDITTNDFVVSYNVETNEYEHVQPTFVIPVPSSIEKGKMEIEFEDGSIVCCTEDHKFYTTNRGWVEAKDLNEEDDIKNFHEIN
jgi:hypothetical protein